jgi:hypothetical protein
MSNTIDWGKIHYNSWSPETNLTGAGATPSFSNTKSILLDGIDDFVTMGNDTSLQPSNFTICLWVKTDNNNSNRTFIHNCAADFGSSRMGFLVQQSFGNYYFRIGNGTANTTVFNGGLIVDTWQFLALSYDGVNMKSYLNAALQDTAAVSNITYGTNATWNPFYIGRTSGGSQYASGNIDEVSLFNSELSASDITSIYNSGVPNDISSLSPVGWWRCGDGDTSPTLTDNGSGGNDGTMTNFTTFSTDVPT